MFIDQLFIAIGLEAIEVLADDVEFERMVATTNFDAPAIGELVL